MKQRIVIIGGSSGIGFAVAEKALILSEDTEVIIASRNLSKLKQAQQQLKNKVVIKQVDLTKEESVQALFDSTGEFDHLVISGNESRSGLISEFPVDKAKATFDSKFWGNYIAIKYAKPHINLTGSIVLFSGRYSQRPGDPGTSILGAVNSAVEGLMRALAVELTPIRVNAVSPGLTNTEFFDSYSKKKREALFANAIESFVIKRPAKPEEVAQAVIYLIGNTYVTGSTLCVNGGYSFH